MDVENMLHYFCQIKFFEHKQQEMEYGKMFYFANIFLFLLIMFLTGSYVYVKSVQNIIKLCLFPFSQKPSQDKRNSIQQKEYSQKMQDKHGRCVPRIPTKITDNNNHIQRTEYNVTTVKPIGDYDVVLLTDVHYDTIQDPSVLQNKIQEINACPKSNHPLPTHTCPSKFVSHFSQ